MPVLKNLFFVAHKTYFAIFIALKNQLKYSKKVYKFVVINEKLVRSVISITGHCPVIEITE